MVLEKFVRLKFDDVKKKIVLEDTGAEAIDPIQLSGVVIRRYDRYVDNESRLAIRERKCPAGTNAIMGRGVISEDHIIGRSIYHPVVYYKIDDNQARKAHKKDIVNSHYHGDLIGFDGETD